MMGVYQGVRNVCFSDNLPCFVFLKHPLWDSPFYLITDAINKYIAEESVCAMFDPTLR